MIYLDNAATTFPKPPAVPRSVYHMMCHCCANPGRSGHKMSLDTARIVMDARDELAALLGVSDSFQIAFCFNCTDALNTGIRGVLRPGDHVVSTFLEHNSVLRVLNGLQQRDQIQLTLLSPRSDGMLSPDDVEAAFRPNTRLVVLTHASNVTGAVQPIAAVAQRCNAQGVLLLVDAAQTAGLLPIDIEALGIDLLALPGHKGLYGPQGTGALVIRTGVDVQPLREGGTGSVSESWVQPLDLPDRYESGTLNSPGIAGLLEGVRFVRDRFEEIRAREQALTERLSAGLRNIRGVSVYSPADKEKRVSVVAFNVGDRQSGVVADMLDEADIAVRGGLHCAPGAHRLLGTMEQGAVRASVGYFNTPSDIDALLRVIERCD